MSGSRANMIKARGIVTYGSEISVSEGSQRQATNVNIDEEGVITPRRGFNDYNGPTTGAADTTAIVSQIMEYKDAILRQYQDKLEYEDSNGEFQAINGTYAVLREGYRTKWQESNSNLYFTSDTGIKKVSVKNRNSLNADMITAAGGIKAGYASGKSIPTVGGFLPPESKVAYRVLFGTKDINNNLIYGSPSSRFVVSNYNTSTLTQESCSIEMIDNSSIIDGDYFTYTNSTGKYVIYLNQSGGAEEPRTSETIGGIYIEANTGLLANNTAAAVIANAMSAIPNSNVTIDSVIDTKVIIETTEEGDITGITTAKDKDNIASIAARILTTTDSEGDVKEGISSTVEVTGVVPSSATVDYFYQVYRSGTISVSTGLVMNDLDPGDELNLVYESGLTTAEITAGEFSFIDTTPESFRAEAAPLYINNTTGEGILQANEVPPIALDVELFRNYMFYANTKEKHRLEFTIVSVDNFISGSTRIVVGNSDITRFYNFVGTAEVTDVTIDAVPTAGDYINLYSANDERQYYIYFGAVGDDPDIAGAIGYRVDITDLELFLTYVGTTVYNPGDKVVFNNLNYVCNTITTGIDDTSEDPSGAKTNNGYWDYESDSRYLVADRIESALIDNIDFSIPSYSEYDVTTSYVVGDLVEYTGFKYVCILNIVGNAPSGTASDNTQWEHVSADNVLNITHTNNGYTTGITDGAGSDITISIPTVDGTGELSGTDEGGDVLLSGLVSVGQSIDETARSLVKVISKDPNSPVNAYYLSTGEDLPGNILLEARSLEDKNFYIAIESGIEDYVPATIYQKGDYVKFENADYVAKKTTTGAEDPSDPLFWEEFLIGAEFTPELSSSNEIENIEGNTTYTTITKNYHGFITGDSVFVGIFESEYDNTIAYSTSNIISYNKNVYECILGTTGPGDNTEDPSGDTSNNTHWNYICPVFSGTYVVTKITDNVFTIPVETPTTTTLYVPEFSTIFSPDVESDNKELPNRIYYSKKNEPEAVPIVNYIDVGTQNAEIKRILALRDNLFVLKDDGIYVVSGTSAPDWSVRLIDSTKILAADSAVVLNNQIYCLTEQGVTRITGSGAAIISRGIEDQIDLITNKQFDYASNTFGIAYENDRAYIMFAPKDSTDMSATQAFRYNMFEQTWSKWEYEATCGHVLGRNNKLYLGNADRNHISQERKNNDRTDHSDRNFSADISVNGISSNVIELSTLVGVEANDVVTQEQDVTIGYINNRLLKKMDYFDTGITSPIGSTMYDSFMATTGSNIPNVMQLLYDYLISLDTLLVLRDDLDVPISSATFTNSNVRDYTERLVTRLNDTTTITAIKSYKNPITVTYEAYIESKDVLRNQITTHIERPFVEGSVEIYKGFTCTVEWNPQHFGDPSALKQINYVTIMFDQNNFYSATASFASDASQAVNKVNFKGKGIGYWADMPWSDPNHYWGGVGNDIPFRNPVPRGKQKCRYLSLTFEHKNARESFRILGISGVVRAISSKAYR